MKVVEKARPTTRHSLSPRAMNMHKNPQGNVEFDDMYGIYGDNGGAEFINNPMNSTHNLSDSRARPPSRGRRRG